MGALSLASDLGMGQPMEFALTSCVLATRLGASLGLPASDLRRYAELHQPPGGAPPFTGVYHGREGAATFFLAAAVDVLAFEPQEYVAQGETVVALGHYRFCPKTTGIRYDTDWAMVWRFRGGKIVEFQINCDTATERLAFQSLAAREVVG